MTQDEFLKFLEKNFPLMSFEETSGGTLFGGDLGYDQAEIRKGRTLHVFNDVDDKGPIDIHFKDMDKDDLVEELTRAGFTYISPDNLETANELLKYHTPFDWDIEGMKKKEEIDFKGEDLEMRYSIKDNLAIILNPVYNNIKFNPEKIYKIESVRENGTLRIYKISE